MSRRPFVISFGGKKRSSRGLPPIGRLAPVRVRNPRIRNKTIQSLERLASLPERNDGGEGGQVELPDLECALEPAGDDL